MNAAYVQQGVLSLGVGHYGLIESVATVIAQEARALGVHLAFSPMLGLGRDPRWGRIEEAYGESPYHVSAMGCAF